MHKSKQRNTHTQTNNILYIQTINKHKNTAACRLLTVTTIVPVAGDVCMLHGALLRGGALEGVALGQGDRGQLTWTHLLTRLLGGGGA